MLSEQDLDRIRTELSGQVPPLEMTFHPAPEASEFSAALGDVAASVASAASEGVRLRQGRGEELVATPALTCSRSGGGPVHYLALPEGLETAPFLELLTGQERSSEEAPGDLQSRLSGRERPAELLVFIAAACPHCPQAVRAANSLALASEQVTVSVIDAQRFPKLAERFKVLSVPVTLLDRELSTTGVVAAETLVEDILSRGTREHEERVFLSLAQAGRLDEASGRLCEGTGAEPFLSSWKKSATSTRMALMMVAEEALTREPAALNNMVPGLVGVLGTEDAALRGDTADLLGQIGHPDSRRALEALLSDPNPDVAEIAAEALGLDE